MFEILFGWRKASKCKRLIKRVQFRLEVLKNKRDSIIRQLQQDVVQLIKTGHHPAALSRIEQIHKDQTVNAVYNLLHSFSDFIIINLSYIRKHRDCPNDINEAVSTLLYASARFGDLPELTQLRKLFGERYGQTFATTAVELLHGNLVNRQIIENLSVKSASDDSKLNLMKEIARDNGIQIDHCEVNGVLELQWHQKSDSDDGVDAPKLHISYEKEVHEIDKSKKSFDIKKNPISGTSANVQSATARAWSSTSNQIHSVNIKSHEEIKEALFEARAVNSCSPYQTNLGSSRSSTSELSASPLQHTLGRITEVEPESPSHFFERQLVYLDEAHEKEKSLLMIKSSIKSVTQSPAAITISLSSTHQDEEKSISHKRKISSRRRQKSRYVVGENSRMKDVEAALYYGEPYELSPDNNRFSLRVDSKGKHGKKMTDAESQNNLFTKSPKKLVVPTSPRVHDGAADCSLENPCYIVTSNNPDDLKNTYPKWDSTKTLKELPPMNLEEGKQEEDNHNFNCYDSDETFTTGINISHKAFGAETNNGTNRMMEEAEVIDCRRSCPSSHDSSRVPSPWRQKVRAPYLRVKTMPTERTKEPNHQIVRYASCLPEQDNQSNIGSPYYIHPKLPDYGDLSVRLRAVKIKSTGN